MSIESLISQNEETEQQILQKKEPRTDEVLSAFLTQLAYFIQILQEFIVQLCKDLKVRQMLHRVQSTISKHPFLTLVTAIIICILSLPFIIFIIFAVTTAVVTFTGFIFIEGTLITIASVLLFGLLCILIFLIVFVVTISLMGYFGFMHIYEFFGKNSLKNIKLT